MNNCTNLEYSSEKLDKTASNVVKLLLQRGWHVAFAESCTGGLLSQTITSVPGASAVYELGICTYANRIKNKFLPQYSQLHQWISQVVTLLVVSLTSVLTTKII